MPYKQNRTKVRDRSSLSFLLFSFSFLLLNREPIADIKKCLNHAYCFLCYLKLEVSRCMQHECQQVQLVGLFFFFPPWDFDQAVLEGIVSMCAAIALRLWPLKRTAQCTVFQPELCLGWLLFWYTFLALCWLSCMFVQSFFELHQETDPSEKEKQ